VGLKWGCSREDVNGALIICNVADRAGFGENWISALATVKIGIGEYKLAGSNINIRNLKLQTF